MLFILAPCFSQTRKIQVDIFGDTMCYPIKDAILPVMLNGSTEKDIVAYIQNLEQKELLELSASLMVFKEKYKLDDWIYYQLIRKTAEQLVPKAKNYIVYTIYKWYLLHSSGYDALLTYSNGKLLFYVNCDENIYNIPIRKENNKQYVCLNYHDYSNINFKEELFKTITEPSNHTARSFSYNVTHLPITNDTKTEKTLQFNYNDIKYEFKIKLNPTVAAYFRNYPTLDYEQHFNIPFTAENYNALIPSLKKHVKNLSTKAGVDFLMHFTRYAFLFQPDTEQFGKEKRYSPEMTLLSETSDCEDRVSLFYYLIKEIYDLPMIVMVYPKHVSIAVHFDRSFGKTIEYKGKKFTICDPTPQNMDLQMGETLPALKHETYQIAFAYEPKKK